MKGEVAAACSRHAERVLRFIGGDPSGCRESLPGNRGEERNGSVVAKGDLSRVTLRMTGSRCRTLLGRIVGSAGHYTRASIAYRRIGGGDGRDEA